MIMGLDMYLRADKYVGGWDHNPKYSEFDALVKLTGMKPTDASPTFYVSATVAYWRKCNQIHKWFTDTLADGRDECQEVYVTRENLETLLDLCKQVKIAHSLAPELLPTESGFFFGSTDYDQYYMEDIDWTIEQLSAILKNPVYNDCDFKYQASW
jgi:hypothetical protein